MLPYTLNRYIYCYNSSINYVDLNGREPDNPNELQLPKEFIFDADPAPEPLIPLFPFITSESSPSTTFELPEFFKPDTNEKSVTPFSGPAFVPYNKEYSVIVKNDNIVDVYLEVGTGLYADFDVAGIGTEVGGKIYLSFNNLGKYYTILGAEAGAGFDAVIVGGTAGYKYETYLDLNTVVEEGLFVDPKLLGFREENGELFFSIEASLYVAIGGGIKLDFNVSKALRDLQKLCNDFADAIQCSE